MIYDFGSGHLADARLLPLAHQLLHLAVALDHLPQVLPLVLEALLFAVSLGLGVGFRV